ncbi:hypothetical protein FJ444_18930 [Aestuariibacter sp. GS-14]|uniref:hypothetical protein n=1 Tax=Aestuariibacter sp. GS-14 TaxID=2590670 RepID=UPI0011292740|nr:hypothetical protein [Aestuariibacter sp. GS-14]TPV54578.1 hypothetical protein FJ444_18930 [Aestuariibacter sp. GS-14]
MTLSKKKSRPITVDGESYRFQISTSKLDENHNFFLNLTVLRDVANGKAMQVKGLVTRNFWLDISDSENYEIDNYPVIRPSHVATIVRKAIAGGWDSSPNGNALVLATTNDDVFKSGT